MAGESGTSFKIDRIESRVKVFVALILILFDLFYTWLSNLSISKNKKDPSHHKKYYNHHGIIVSKHNRVVKNTEKCFMH